MNGFLSREDNRYVHNQEYILQGHFRQQEVWPWAKSLWNNLQFYFSSKGINIENGQFFEFNTIFKGMRVIKLLSGLSLS